MDMDSSAPDTEVARATVIVTGGASGIGLATCQHLAAENYAVVSCDVQHPPAGEEVLSIENGKVAKVRYDVRDRNGFNAILRHLNELGRTPTGLVNGAAILSRSPILGLDVETLDRVMDVNFRAVAMLTVQFAQNLEGNSIGGSVVNISSIHAGLSEPAAAPYTAAKGAVEAFSRTAASELAEFDVRVNCIRPGAIDTPMARPTYTPEVIQGLMGRIPMKRLGKAAEVAGLIEFLLSAKSTYVTGSVMTVDGGFSSHGGLPDAAYSY